MVKTQKNNPAGAESESLDGISPAIYRPRAADLIVAAQALVFSILSFSFPDSGVVTAAGLSVSRGAVMGVAILAVGAFAMLIPFADERRAPGWLSFIRTFYPQAVTGLFFLEAIVLSSMIFDGFSWDWLFARLDAWAFGFQPSREFSRALSSSPFVNELMFGSYFMYYVVMAVTPWIPWFMGRRKEARRMIFALVAFMAIFDLWYVFFRVQGPKYWFGDLHALWYSEFRGGVFVRFFQGLFERATLSGAAFPSSHVAGMTLFTFMAARIDRRLAAAYGVLTALVIAATVYLYAHYAADAVAGLAISLALSPVLLRAYDGAESLAARLVDPDAAAARRRVA